MSPNQVRCTLVFKGFAKALLLTAAILQAPLAQAIPISPDISITGSTFFDTVFSYGPTSGDFGVTAGGATTFTTYTGSTPTGANPLAGTLTDTGDGFGFKGSASVTGDTFGIGIDTGISLSNSSATDSYAVVFDLVYSNFVNADGPDAVVDSELTLDIDLVEAFFSDLVSDTVFGDEDGGVALGTFGDPLSDAGTFSFTITLAPSASAILDLTWTVDDFSGDYATGLAELDTSAFLGVSSVTSLTPPPAGVPEPGTVLLLAAGLLGLTFARKSIN